MDVTPRRSYDATIFFGFLVFIWVSSATLFLIGEIKSCKPQRACFWTASNLPVVKRAAPLIIPNHLRLVGLLNKIPRTEIFLGVGSLLQIFTINKIEPI